MDDVRVPVLVVGGGPVGLSLGIFLRRHGVDTLVVEKRGSTSFLPRAPGLQARTMELFRAAGFAPRAPRPGSAPTTWSGPTAPPAPSGRSWTSSGPAGARCSTR